MLGFRMAIKIHLDENYLAKYYETGNRLKLCPCPLTATDEVGLG